jgi:hypothetical protein
MIDLKETEIRIEAAKDAVTAQLAKIKSIESRQEQINSELHNFDKLLIEAAFIDPDIDWARYATGRLGLELEKATLPDVIVRLKEPLPALQAAAQRATREIERLRKENADDGWVEKIRGMLTEGKTQRIIQEECALVDHDFYRVLAKAKRALIKPEAA